MVRLVLATGLLALFSACTSFGTSEDGPPPADASAPEVAADGAVVVAADAGARPPTDGDGGPRTWRAVFVSRGDVTGDLSGPAKFDRADAICQAEATKAGLVGTFVALVRPGPNGSVVDRANAVNGSLDRFVPAPGAERGSPAISLSKTLDPRGVRIDTYADGVKVIEDIRVWTGGLGAAAEAATCRAGTDDWFGATEDHVGAIGDPRQTGKQALDMGTTGCDERHHLYCVER